MLQLVYVMRFTGGIVATGPDDRVLVMNATAPSAPLTPASGFTDLCSVLQTETGAEVSFTSELTRTGKTSFQEVGTMAVGNGHRLRFATVGSGYVGPGPDTTCQQGAAIWRVEGGEGHFAGVRGLITSNFSMDGDHGTISHHLGVLFLP